MTEYRIDDTTLASLRAVWPHRGAAADRVRQLKYGDRSVAVTVLADAMAAIASPADLITWCPASPAALRERGYDQSELLARALAHRLRIPARRLLRRERRDRPQTERDRAGRLVGPHLHAAGRLRRRPAVLLVDDVTTTGATLVAAATLLRRSGAGRVHGLVATRAERPRPDTADGLGVRSELQPIPGGYEWTSPSAHGT